ncbi:D-isomer specific 2-hydroxyacid dehydrogenase NAD-binding [Sulfolobus islandicus Y.G.57.14]|jgi:D-3-phosphoglycerate dehydrogenase|uniref:Phosphoglycerate dehydrogenase-related dehydrogenase n=9 Tax=Saccharolobus islandicus TaxID=43080 RepID=M9U6L0_SACIS|nr:NAD(P)-dependent oxidoreductase [Sulfolobus islandicus]ACP35411.1 D-isomer specific 2-hydroxyacid dehydrogenase NAD-binding [Sulfolobus islandicus L.S.2.15]ACP38070.1 D-isomer specific 2-hydroxyacid dehydrogenase NAD-binding [Sulfolobus islandicus M.14.25]ACP45577.1 D-isomer specific 2-hydroxyacid dehydrogenase NAD-binding [Sulfolobus islandicus Y.G.57.14]ACP55249.1 D-isomer specific 2-hydroxyacid dehydrogenase NAD-binding [Sulfolobus islandicus M.16.27]ACR41904.1 D-isomer specific 2-hydrox
METIQGINSINKLDFKVLITDPVDQYMIKTLQNNGLIVDYKPEISREELLKIIDQYQVLVVRSRTKVDKEIIRYGTNLKIIARAGIGLDNIDTEEASKRNIKIVYAAGASTDSAAELTIGLLLTAARKLYDSMNMAKGGIFKKIEGIELAGKTIGVIGFGRIGTKVAKVCKALDMNVIAYDVIDIKEKANMLGVKVAESLDELLKNSDVITFHVTVGKDAKPILNKDTFNYVKDNTIIINTSRAVVIDGKALLEYIDKKQLTYATDVLWNEPPKEDWEIKLLRHERVIVTTHIGAQTKEAQYRVAVVTTDNLITSLKEIGVLK